MDIDEIRQLVELMVSNELTELDVGDGEMRVHIKRGAEAPAAIVSASPPAPKPEDTQQPADDETVEIRSPMVGTFFAAPSPESDPYVQLGAIVTEDSPVCIIEAMKVMNEVKAECSGTIVEICVRNAHPVEFGQVLFRVRPA